MKATFCIGSWQMSLTSKILTRSTIQVVGAALGKGNSARIPEIVEMLLGAGSLFD